MTPDEYARELAEATADERARLESERLTLEFSQPLVQAHRRKRPRRKARELPLLDPQQEDLFR